MLFLLSKYVFKICNLDADAGLRPHNIWYADYSGLIEASYPWMYRGGHYNNGVIAGTFYFSRGNGSIKNSISTRLILAP